MVEAKSTMSRGTATGVNGPMIDGRESIDPRSARVMDDASHGILVQRDGKILYANAKYAEMLGYDDANELVELNDALKLVWPEDRDYLNQIRTGRPLGDAPDRYEHRCLTKDGEAVWVEARVHRVEWDQDSALQVNVHDITDRREMMSALSRSEARFREQETRYRKTLDTVNQAIISLDEASRIVEFNTAAEGLFGYAAKEVLGRTIHVLMPDDLRNSGDGPLEIYRRGARSPTNKKARRFRGRRKDTIEFPYEMTVRVWRSNNERFMTGVIRDLTIELETQRAMSVAKQAAEEAFRLKSEFLASMSHELRTPLNAILGFSQLLASDLQDPLTADHSRFVGQIEKAGGRLLSMINEIIDMAKIDAGHMIVAATRVNVGDLLERGHREIASRLEAKEARFTWWADPVPEIWVRGDEARILQCIRSVLGQVVDLIGPGGGVSVDIRNQIDDELWIEFKATGVDIAPEQLDQIFEVFGRMSNNGGLMEGVGLGLAIAKRLVDLMNGSLAARFESRHDICFDMRLPLASKPLARDQTTSGSGETELGAAIVPRDMTLLYVEDNQANRFLMLQIVAKLPGIALILAETGRTGVEFFDKYRPDLVILDINLPDIDGYEVLRRIRCHADGSVPVLALSANATENDVSKGYLAGFDEYLTKPVVVPRLVTAIEQALERGEDG